MVFVNVHIHFRIPMDPDPEPSSYGSGSGSLRIRIHNTGVDKSTLISATVSIREFTEDAWIPAANTFASKHNDYYYQYLLFTLSLIP
jgi:hypothetical protein